MISVSLEKRLGKISVSAFGVDALLEKSDEELNTFCENFEADLAKYEEHEGEAQNDAKESSEEELDDETEDVESDFSGSNDDTDSASEKPSRVPYNPTLDYKLSEVFLLRNP